jgi:uncharacterized protein
MRVWNSVLMTLALVFFWAATGLGQQIVIIGTGNVTGVYYPAGGAIAKIVNMNSGKTGLKVIAEATEGSNENIRGCVARTFDFGLAQSDIQYRAFNGEAEWKERGPQKTLRSVFSLFPEAVTLVAHSDRDIVSIGDLAGKKVSVGSLNSGQREAIIVLMKALGLQDKTEILNLEPVDALALFEKGELDAFFFTVGHPNYQIMEATYKNKDAMIVPVAGPQVDKLLEKALFYTKDFIEMKDYPRASNSKVGKVLTVGIKATLTTSASVPEGVVYKITKEIFENLDTFKQTHPALASLTPKNMLKSLSAPLHPGALKYYREAGLLKHVDPELLDSGKKN